MEACCCIDSSDGLPSVHRDETRTARKAHRCCECGDTIEPGEQYEYATGLWDGDWNSYKTCWFCVKVRNDFFSCGWNYTMMREDFYECHDWDYAGKWPDRYEDDSPGVAEG